MPAQNKPNIKLSLFIVLLYVQTINYVLHSKLYGGLGGGGVFVFKGEPTIGFCILLLTISFFELILSRI